MPGTVLGFDDTRLTESCSLPPWSLQSSGHCAQETFLTLHLELKEPEHLNQNGIWGGSPALSFEEGGVSTRTLRI